MSNLTPLLSSKKMDYCTPKDLFESLDKTFNFALDAAATPQTAKCKRFYTPENSGLTNSWDTSAYGGGAVFCNPPYGRGIKKWIQKAHKEAQEHPDQVIVLLIPARTDTSYFHDYIYKQSNVEIRFLRGRLKFEDEKGKPFDAAPFPSMLVIYN